MRSGLRLRLWVRVSAKVRFRVNVKVRKLHKLVRVTVKG